MRYNTLTRRTGQKITLTAHRSLPSSLGRMRCSDSPGSSSTILGAELGVSRPRCCGRPRTLFEIRRPVRAIPRSTRRIRAFGRRPGRGSRDRTTGTARRSSRPRRLARRPVVHASSESRPPPPPLTAETNSHCLIYLRRLRDRSYPSRGRSRPCRRR